MFTDDKGKWPDRETTDRDQLRGIQRCAKIARPDGTLFTTHKLRNTTAIRLLELGAASEVVSQIMGRTQTETTEIYYRQVHPRLLTALTNLASHYESGK